LIRAAHRGHAEIVRSLIEAGIELDHVNRLGWTALLEAIILGDGGQAQVETVRALVDGGVDVDIPDREGVTPREHAARAGYDEIVAILDAADR
jgi:ankyrin repeat protein